MKRILLVAASAFTICAQAQTKEGKVIYERVMQMQVRMQGDLPPEIQRQMPKPLSVFPIRAIYQFSPAGEKSGLLAGVTASKKHFKRAVDRNRVKRLLREAYRLQKEDLVQQVRQANVSGRIFFIYTDKTIADFETIMTAMGKCLQRLSKTIQSENHP